MSQNEDWFHSILEYLYNKPFDAQYHDLRAIYGNERKIYFDKSNGRQNGYTRIKEVIGSLVERKLINYHETISNEYRDKSVAALGADRQNQELEGNENTLYWMASITSEGRDYMREVEKGKGQAYNPSNLEPIVQKKKIPSSDFPDEVYRDVIKTLSDYGKVIEQKTKVYKHQDEEGLRDHFLISLTGRYEKTTATGETFNKEGRADIILKDDKGNNLFIAECKRWKGLKVFHSTINQLFDRYMTWRDTKVAILFFVNNKSFSKVLEKVQDEAKKHQYYVEYLGTSDRTNFRFIFKQKNDARNRVQVEIMFFHFPK